jgi:hypothetical protein
MLLNPSDVRKSLTDAKPMSSKLPIAIPYMAPLANDTTPKPIKQETVTSKLPIAVSNIVDPNLNLNKLE